MKIKRNSLKKLNILQFLTLTSAILLLSVYIREFGHGFEAMLASLFVILVFLPNFVGWVYKLSHEELKHSIMAELVIAWTCLLYIISIIITYMYEKYLGEYAHLISLIPSVILISYLTYYKEWGNFYRSLSRMHLEDYIRKKAEERAKEMELEFGEMLKRQ